MAADEDTHERGGRVVVTAVRGAVGFLSRLPVGQDAAAWESFTTTPVAFPLAGWLLGPLLAAPLLLPGPPAVGAFGVVVAVYLLTGVTHADGVADLGDAAVVHGDAERRRAVMRDSDLGAGGALALVVTVGGLFTAAAAVGRLPVAVGLLLVVVAEVGAKFGMGALVCLGTATHEGLASSFTRTGRPGDVRGVLAATVPAAALGGVLDTAGVVAFQWAALTASTAALTAAVGVTGGMLWWARRRLGGVSGDVLGATNEFARVVALHTGVVTWTIWTPS